jgi:chromosome segregation ATPase
MQWVTSKTMRAAGVGLALVGVLEYGQAQVPRSGGDSHVMQELQELGAARAALQTENTQLKKDLDAAKDKLNALSHKADQGKHGIAECQQALQVSQATVHTDEQSIEQGKQRLQELIAKFRETAAATAVVETERTQCKQQLGASQGQFEQCATRNAEMYKITDEVLKRLDHESVFTVMARSEPFTRIERTRVENLVDDYRTKAGELKVQPAAVSAPVSAGGTK